MKVFNNIRYIVLRLCITFLVLGKYSNSYDESAGVQNTVVYVGCCPAVIHWSLACGRSLGVTVV